MSIVDFLGDDGTDQSPEVKPVYEEHVAFSVDGNLPICLIHMLDLPICLTWSMP